MPLAERLCASATRCRLSLTQHHELSHHPDRAKPAAMPMVLIGNGAQSECQTLAFHIQLGIEELSVFDVDLLATEKLVRKLQSKNLFRFARGGGARAPLRRVA